MNFQGVSNIKLVDITAVLALLKVEDESKMTVGEKNPQEEEEKTLFEIGGNGSEEGSFNNISDIESAIKELDKQELDKNKKSNFATKEKKRNELVAKLKEAEFKEEEKKNIITSKIKDEFVNDKTTIGNISIQINELHNETQRRELKSILNEMRHIKELNEKERAVGTENVSLDNVVSKLDLVQ